MWFSGKRYRRTRCENVESWMKATRVSEALKDFILKKAPIFSFTKMDDGTIKFVLEIDDRFMNYVFKLGEALQLERVDGTKITITFTLEGDNVLNQCIKQSDGRVTHFRREFDDKESKMIVTIDNYDIKPVLYFEEIK